jgi:hypothetical protein
MVKNKEVLDECVELHKYFLKFSKKLNKITMDSKNLEKLIGTKEGKEKFLELLSLLKELEPCMEIIGEREKNIISRCSPEDAGMLYVKLGAAIVDERYEDCKELTKQIEDLEK